MFAQTVPLGINDAGEITGYYIDPASGYRGFLLTPGGTFNPVDYHPARKGTTLTGTIAEAINSTGEIMGFYTVQNADLTTADYVFRLKNGNFTSFDPASKDPAGNNGLFLGASSFAIVDGSINPAGWVVGFFNDSQGYWGFLLNPGGTITPINEPNSNFGGGPPLIIPS